MSDRSGEAVAVVKMPLFKLPFVKMHGAGNDFLMIRQADLAGPLTGPQIAALCDRRKGIGGDGLIILTGEGPAPAGAATQFGMVYFNSDGGEAEMCGNGARCTFEFARSLGLVAGSARFSTRAGVLEGRIFGPGDLEVELPPWRDLQVGLELAGCPWTDLGFCNTGVPHLVVPVAGRDELDAIDLGHWGPILRGHERFGPAGANVNWVCRWTGGHLRSICAPSSAEWRPRPWPAALAPPPRQWYCPNSAWPPARSAS